MTRFPTWAVRLGLVAIVLAIYWPALQFGYVDFDDPEYVTANPLVQNGVTLEGLTWAFTARDAANWHPVTWLSLMLDTNIFGNNARGHHLMNIALHAVNVLLLLSVLSRMTAAPWRSALVAALFAAHPMHVESVAWISERKDVLSMLFWLLAIRAYAAHARDRDARQYAVVALWMAMSLMSKPMAVTLPGILLLLDFWPLNRFGAKAFTRAWFKRFAALLAGKLPLLAIAIASSIVTMWAQLGRGVLQEGRWLTLAERAQNVVIAYVMYLGKLFWPIDLACLYPNPLHQGDFAWPLWQAFAALGLLVAITAIGIAFARRAPWLLVGWLWYVMAMIPVIGIVEIGRQIIADRYAYIPFVGLYIIIAWMLGAATMRLRLPRAMVGVVCVAAISALGFIAHRQVYVWRGSETLFRHAATATERNWLMINNLAGVLERENRRDEAIPLLDQATAICHDCAWVHQHRGEVLARAGRLFEAQASLQRAIELDPDFGLAHANLGTVLAQRGQTASGATHLKKAVEIQPLNAPWRVQYATVLALSGLRDDAIRQMEEAIRLQPQRAMEWQPALDAIRSQRDARPR